MAKKIKLIFSVWLLIIATLLVYAFLKRTPILNLLIVKSDKQCNPDLIAVLGGGIRQGKPGISTTERLNALLQAYKTEKKKPEILICEYPKGKEKMKQFLKNSIKEEFREAISKYKYIETTGGTENNIKDILNYLKTRKNIKSVLIITSPYHQRRTYLILKKLSKQLKIGEDISFCFYQMNNYGEILTCSNKRFAKLIVHEFAGIVYELLNCCH